MPRFIHPMQCVAICVLKRTYRHVSIEIMAPEKVF